VLIARFVSFLSYQEKATVALSLGPRDFLMKTIKVKSIAILQFGFVSICQSLTKYFSKKQTILIRSSHSNGLKIKTMHFNTYFH